MGAIVAEAGLVGLAYALVEGGEIGDIAVFGTVEPGGAPVTTETPFRVGSVSKNVTALLAAALAAEGVVPLDAPVGPLLPDGTIDNPWEAAVPLRLVHLLEHTGGLPGSSHRDYGDFADDASPADAVAASAPIRLRWPPGRHYSYANAGHTLAALALERAAGAPFDDLVRAKVLGPLGMARAGFRWTDPAAAGLAPSFDAEGRPAGLWRMSVRPSGALMASIADLARLTRFHATGGASAPVATPALVERMRRPGTGLAAEAGYQLSYGLGMFGFVEAGQVFWGHWGRTDGYQASFGVLPGTGRGFAIVTNSADRAGFAAARAAVARHVARGLAPLAPPPEVAADGAAFAGWWAPFTEDMVARAWIAAISGLTLIEAEGEGLRLATPLFPAPPRRLIPVGDGFWREEGAPAATHLFLDDADRTVLFGDQHLTFRRVSPWELAGLGLVAFAIAAGIGGGAVAALRRRRPGARAWAALAAAALGLAALVWLYVAWGVFGQGAALGDLGRPSPRALALGALSFAWPAAAAIGAAALVRDWRRVGAAQRGLGAATVAGLGLAAAGLASQGWLPLLTWRG